MTSLEFLGIVGTLHAVIELTTGAASILKDFTHHDEDAKSLKESLSPLLLALRLYTSLLEKTLPTLAPDEQTEDLKQSIWHLLLDSDTSLAVLRARLDYSITRLKKSQGSVAFKTIWALWRKKEFLLLRDDLERWVRSFHLIFVAINSEESRRMDHDTYDRTVRLFRGLGEGSQKEVSEHLHEWASHDIEVLQEDFDIALVRICNNKIAIAEFIRYDTGTSVEIFQSLHQRTLNTAKSLCQADALQTRMLRCSGFYLDEPSSRMGLVFDIPAGHCVRESQLAQKQMPTLHATWNSKPPAHGLNQRFRLALDIATGVLYVHAVGWLLKGLTPMSIILLDEIDADGMEPQRNGYLPRAFLVGVQGARQGNAVSSRRSTTEWQMNIYRHPKRQSAENAPKYRMAFDVYSLGVVLLELGLWSLPHFRRFVSSPAVFAKANVRTDEILKQFVKGSTPENREAGRGIHCSMGPKYRDVVEYCLERETSNDANTLEVIKRVWKVLQALPSAV